MFNLFHKFTKKDLMYQIQCGVYYLVMSTIDWLCRRRGGPKWKFCLELLWYMPLWQTSSLWSIPNRWSFLKWWVLILVFIYQWIVKIQRRETCQREAQTRKQLWLRSHCMLDFFFSPTLMKFNAIKNMLKFLFQQKTFIYAPTYSLLGKGWKKKKLKEKEKVGFSNAYLGWCKV